MLQTTPVTSRVSVPASICCCSSLTAARCGFQVAHASLTASLDADRADSACTACVTTSAMDDFGRHAVRTATTRFTQCVWQTKVQVGAVYKLPAVTSDSVPRSQQVCSSLSQIQSAAVCRVTPNLSTPNLYRAARTMWCTAGHLLMSQPRRSHITAAGDVSPKPATITNTTSHWHTCRCSACMSLWPRRLCASMRRCRYTLLSISRACLGRYARCFLLVVLPRLPLRLLRLLLLRLVLVPLPERRLDLQQQTVCTECRQHCGHALQPSSPCLQPY